MKYRSFQYLSYKVLISLLLFYIHFGLNAQSDEYSTYIYHKNDTLELGLDLFQPCDSLEKIPLIIFMHGGGFSAGKRSYGHDFCRDAAEHGIAAATISYTLSMNGKHFSCEGILQEKIKAIQMAAYESRLATQWFINNAELFSIDTTKIFISGSSAGAEAALQAAYWDRDAENYFPDVLSPSFRYAGVISGAGALIDINMINDSTKIPTVCYHGTCDRLVPYYIAPHHYCSQISSGFMMMFGGLAIHERLIKLNENSILVTYCGEGHQHAATPFRIPESLIVFGYINKILNGEKLNIHRIIKNGITCELSLDFPYCY